jgi:hypothetical protein
VSPGSTLETLPSIDDWLAAVNGRQIERPKCGLKAKTRSQSRPERHFDE